VRALDPAAASSATASSWVGLAARALTAEAISAARVSVEKTPRLRFGACRLRLDALRLCL